MKIQPQVMSVPPLLYVVIDLPDDIPLGMVFAEHLDSILQDVGDMPHRYYQIAVQDNEQSLIMGFTNASYSELVSEMSEENEGAPSALLPLAAISEDDEILYLLLDGVLDGPAHLYALTAVQQQRRLAVGDKVVGLRILESRLDEMSVTAAGGMQA